MVEEYASNLSYKSYFDECALLSCTYSYVKSHDATEATLSLYGGLLILTRCLAGIIDKIMYRDTRRINPETTD
jgi:hypothetical protein